MKALNLVLIILGTLTFYSCGSNVPKSNLKVSLAAVAGSLNFPGGLTVVGKQIDGGQKFLRVVERTDDVIELELNQGLWNFVVIGWDGASNFEGNNYCDFLVGFKLDQEEVAISLEASQSKCNVLDRETNTIPIFGPSDSAGQFPKLVFNSCGGIKNYIAEGQFSPQVYCGPGNDFDIIPGGLKSFKVHMGQLFPDGIMAIGMSSRCVTESTLATTGETRGFSDLRLPFGSERLEFFYKIEAFSDSNCQTLNKTIVYDRGLIGVDPTGTAVNTWDSSKNYSQFFLHSDLCDTVQVAKLPFANSPTNGVAPVSGSPRLICNKAHWQSINADLGNFPGETYILGGDINLLGSNVSFTNVFKGQLRGSGYRIYNGDQPLLGDIQVFSSNDDVRISDLIIEDMQLNITTGAENFGILAKSITGNTSGSRIEIDRISLLPTNHISVGSGSYDINVGGVVGRIDFFTNPSSNNELYIRMVDARVSIDGSLNTSTLSSYGGIVGRAEKTQVQPINMAIEEFSVGVNNQQDMNDITGQITIKGLQNVGGVAGFADGLEVRSHGAVQAQLFGNSNIGGIVGLAANDVRIQGIFGQSTLRPLGAGPGNGFGGIVGKFNSGSKNLSVSDVIAVSSAPNNGNIIVNNLGGILGHIQHDASLSSVHLSNNKAAVNFAVNGANIGGIIGNYNDTSSGGGGPVIYNSLVTGGIYVEDSSNSANTARGGFVGSMTQGEIAQSRVLLSGISGFSNMGGAIGDSTGGAVRESEIKFSSMTVFSSTAAGVNVGGIFGTYSDPALPFSGAIDGVKASGTILVSSISSDCTTASCGSFVGYQNSTQANLIAYSIGEISLSNSVGAMTNLNCGINDHNCSGGIISSLFSNSMSSTCSGLAAATFPFADDAGVCRPRIAMLWDKFGKTSLGDVRVGNRLEPFGLSTPGEWNSIGTDKFLLSKSYELLNNIDFLSASFVPIGGDDAANFDQKFTGSLLPRGHKILNVSHTTYDIGTDTYKDAAGLFPILSGGSVGDWGDPLVIENLTLTCQHNNCGVVGQLESGDVNVQVINGLVQGSAASNVGGLVGYASGDYGRISDSGFEGQIVVGSASNVGGLVGYAGNGSNTTFYIEGSYVKLNGLLGNSNIGGLAGYLPASGSGRLSIESSYVWILDGTVGDDVSGNANLAGFVGIAESGSSLSVRASYIDFSAAQVAPGFVSHINGSGLTSFSTESTFSVGKSISGLDDGNLMAVIDYNDLYDSMNDDHYWVMDANGVMRLYWEINGFDNNH